MKFSLLSLSIDNFLLIIKFIKRLIFLELLTKLAIDFKFLFDYEFGQFMGIN